MLKRLFSLLLCLCMALSVCPTVFAAEDCEQAPAAVDTETPEAAEESEEAAADPESQTDAETPAAEMDPDAVDVTGDPGSSAEFLEGSIVPSQSDEKFEAPESLIQSRASYPLVYVSTLDSNSTIPLNDTAVTVFKVWPEYKNEKLQVRIYDSNGNLVGSSTTSMYNVYSSIRTVTISANTKTLGMSEGTYTIKYWMDFYSLYSWHSSPNAYTTKLTVVSNSCQGNHSFVQNSVYSAATCEKEGTARMVCSKCGHTVYQTIPATGHTWDSGNVTTVPTADECGVRTYTCTNCGTTKTSSIPALETAPEKPYKIAAVVSGVHVYWTAVEGATKYGVWRSETGKDGTYKWIANPTVPHFTDTSVESGKTYFYRITILNTDYNQHTNKSEAIGITYVSTPDITSRTNTAAGIELGWDKITGATGYAIYRKSYDGTDAWVRIATIEDNKTFSWTDTSVKNSNGEVYRYTIRALAGSNMATLSGCRNTGRTMVRLSSQVLTSAVKVSSTSVKCSWTTSSRVTGYEIRFMIGDTVYKTYTVGNYKTGVKTFTDLAAGKTYTVQVRTYKKVDGVGSFYSDWSTAKTVTT